LRCVALSSDYRRTYVRNLIPPLSKVRLENNEPSVNMRVVIRVFDMTASFSTLPRFIKIQRAHICFNFCILTIIKISNWDKLSCCWNVAWYFL